jgi:membrane protein required for colicin V production
MALDLLALGLLVVFAWLGARRGALATGLSLAGIVGGYAAAWWAATRLGATASEALGVTPLLGAPLAGSAAFGAVVLATGIVSWIARRRTRDVPATPASRAGGALFGALRGGLVALAIGLLAIWLDASRMIGSGGATTPPTDTPLRVVTRSAVEGGVAAALGDAPGADAAARALAHPGESIQALQSLVETPEVQALAQDAAFWSYVEAGALDAALAEPSFQRLQWNAERRRQLAALGLVEEFSAGDPALFALQMRGALAAIGPRLRALRNDPELAQLARDPAVADLLARRDWIGVLQHASFQRVLARALAPAPERG